LSTTLTKSGYLLLALAAIVQPVAADEWHYNDIDRVVAISDIHGAYAAMIATLQNAHVIDETLGWSGAGTHLVIVGDILDRGPDSRDVMDLLMRLEEEAVPAGGKVHVLIGNHEVMNLVGDMRYVSKSEYAAFAIDETIADRDRWFDAYRSLRELPGQSVEESRAAFDIKFPAGFFAQRSAFAADGKYGKWLLSKPVMAVINGTAFVHGGLSPGVAETGLPGVNIELVNDVSLYVRQLGVLIEEQLLLPTDGNAKHVAQLARFSPLLADRPAVIEAVSDIRQLNDPLFAIDSPHWYRGHSYCSEIIEGDRIQSALQKIGAARVVIGHTPTPSRRVLERLGGRVIEIDTGMLSSYYKGSGNALVMENGSVLVINEDGSEAVRPMPAPRQVGMRPGQPMLAEEIEELLRTGEIIVGGEEEEHLSVTNGEQTIDAMFTQQLRVDIYPEVAAYRLDRLLKLDMVPVTVVREIDGEKGSLQFVPVKWIDEAQRQVTRAGGGAWCPLPVQWTSMTIFDMLAANNSRSAETIRYNLSTWQLMLIGHARAFTVSTSQSTRFKDGRVRLGRSWKAALQSLEPELLREQLGDVLDKRRIRALSKRRDLLLNE